MAFGHQKRLIQTDTQQRQWKIVIMVLPLASDYMVQILPLCLMTCETLGKLLYFSEPVSLPVKEGH